MRMKFVDEGIPFNPVVVVEPDEDIIEQLAEQARQREVLDPLGTRAALAANEEFADAAARRWATSKDCGCRSRDKKPLTSGERFAMAARDKWSGR